MQVMIGSQLVTGVTAARLELDYGRQQPSSSTVLTPTIAVVVEDDPQAQPVDPGTGTDTPAAGS